MATSNRPNNQRPNDPVRINDPELINKIIDIESRKIQLQIENKSLHAKEIEHNAKIAEQSLAFQAEYLKNKPKQNRYTLITYATILLVLLALCMGFIMYLLHENKEDFANKLILFITHIFTLLFGYLAGKNKKKDTFPTADQSIQEAEIME